MVYAAFLRAINVGGHATVRMTDLRDAFLAAGCTNVRTVIQSGNVVFEAPAAVRPAVVKRVCRRLESLVGKDPGVFVRTHRELASLVEADPFRTFAGEQGVKLYVAFLGGEPARVPRLPLRSDTESVEAFATNGRDVFIVSRKKRGNFYGFPNGVVEKEFGVAATTRNWNTVVRVTDAMTARQADSSARTADATSGRRGRRPV